MVNDVLFREFMEPGIDDECIYMRRTATFNAESLVCLDSRVQGDRGEGWCRDLRFQA